MELIVHENAKNAIQLMMLATDELGFGVTFLFEHLVQPNNQVCLLASIHASCVSNNHHN
jgi:hypothetical protein